MPAPTWFSSVDAGAPTVVANTAGSLVALLDACLVNGYGSKASLGWTIAFTGTNQRVYRPPAGNRFYLFVDDTGVSGIATVAPFIVATGLNTGTGPFSAGANLWIKNAVWDLFGDDRGFYLHSAQSKWGFFGDLYSLLPGDAYGTVIGSNANTSSTTDDIIPQQGSRVAVARGVSQTGTSVGMTLGAYSSSGPPNGGGGLVSWMNPQWPYPNPADNGLHATRVSVGGSSTGIRGYLRGLWCLPFAGSNFSTARTDPTIIDGSGAFAGRQFMVFGSYNVQGSPCFAYELTAWDHN